MQGNKASNCKMKLNRLHVNIFYCVQQEIKAILEGKIIEPSSCESRSPMLIVKKKDGALRIRICVDYRQLNSISQVDVYPMSWIDDVLEQLG